MGFYPSTEYGNTLNCTYTPLNNTKMSSTPVSSEHRLRMRQNKKGVLMSTEPVRSRCHVVTELSRSLYLCSKSSSNLVSNPTEASKRKNSVLARLSYLFNATHFPLSPTIFVVVECNEPARILMSFPLAAFSSIDFLPVLTTVSSNGSRMIRCST